MVYPHTGGIQCYLILCTSGDSDFRNYIQEQEGVAGTTGNPQVKMLDQKLKATNANVCDTLLIFP